MRNYHLKILIIALVLIPGKAFAVSGIVGANGHCYALSFNTATAYMHTWDDNSYQFTPVTTDGRRTYIVGTQIWGKNYADGGAVWQWFEWANGQWYNAGASPVSGNIYYQTITEMESYAASLGVTSGVPPTSYWPTGPPEGCADAPEDPPCPEQGTNAGTLNVPGKYPPPPFCMNDCEVTKNPANIGIAVWNYLANETVYMNLIFTGEVCSLVAGDPTNPYQPANCDEAKGRCVEFCGINNIAANTCSIDPVTNAVLTNCTCKDYPQLKPGETAPGTEPVAPQTPPPAVANPTPTAPPAEAADPEANPTGSVEQWLKSIKHSSSNNSSNEQAELNAIKDELARISGIGTQTNAINANVDANASATAQNTGALVEGMGGLSDGIKGLDKGIAEVNDSVETGNATLGEISDALTDTETGQSTLNGMTGNTYDGAISTEETPVLSDLAAAFQGLIQSNPFTAIFTDSEVNTTSSDACLDFPNPLNNTTITAVCFNEYESIWDAMGLIFLGLCGFMAFRIVKG